LLTSLTSIHTGTVATTCDITATPGALAPSASTLGVPTALASTGGKFETLCNSTGASVLLENGAAPTLAPGSAIAGVTTSIAYAPGTLAYASVLATTIPAAGSTLSAFDNTYSNVVSSLPVSATVTAGTNKVLPNGTYVVNIKATVTP
jgi:hypothetical protein